MSVKYIEELVNISSPTGYTADIIEHIETSLQDSGLIVKKE